MTHRSIHWFRKGLRLHDNPAFLQACEQASHLYPIFVLDPWFVQSTNTRVGINRWRFLLQTLNDLDSQLQALNLRLFVVRGNPLEQLTRLCKKWDITHLTFEVDTEPYAVKRDTEVEKKMAEIGVEVIKCVSHTLYDTAKVVKVNKGVAPLSYRGFQTLAAKLGPPEQPLDAPTTKDLKACQSAAVCERHGEEEFGVPTMADLGKDEQSCGPLLFPGGETEALERMERHLKKTNWVCSFEKPQTAPNSLSPSTTVLSPYIKFGCLSSRLFYHQLAQIYKGKKHSQPPVSLHGQLLWREFFYTVASVSPNFDRMVGNRLCRQIPWDAKPHLLDKWTNGQTGFPFIDAIMRQLRQEGWVHHLARHAVACFLTRGDLWISWEEGMKVFEEFLLDADWSLNAANWMWLSASAFFHQYFRVYSPVAFGKKTDPNGDYIRKYVPEVRKFPAKFIYEPWSAPTSVQQAAGCVIGQDYPRPVVDHAMVSKTNIGKMAAAYKAGQSTDQSVRPPSKEGRQSTEDKKKEKKRPGQKTDKLVQKKLKLT